ncbi:acyltransferase 3 [Lophiotrema nucula]|uniref:Acyltransferase 3 n=1 Tax=Lophiotrema nucula TaxID=690887 RepID=A0A6A5ZSQ9_9PLEO|nr:acyltransferase 3 [Lophiotrema nucula]
MTTRPPGVREPRSFYLDNVRTYLTALVIVHHTSLPYGGFGTWLYKPSPGAPQYPPSSSLPILVFNALNQTYFMATFFLLSGYFSALTARKKDQRTWLKEKWKRLGVPTILYSLFGTGIARGIIASVRDGAGWSEVASIQWDALKAIRGVRGPVWYCALLLIFDMIYAQYAYSMTVDADEEEEGLGLLVKDTEAQKPKEITTKQLCLALGCTASASYLIRYFYPVGKVWTPLALNLGYVPQYVLFYTTGILAYTYLDGELHAIITPRMRLGLSGALIGIDAFGWWSLKAIVDSGQTSLGKIFELSRGGFNQFSALYSIWNEVAGVLLSSVALLTFRTVCNGRWGIGNFDVARYSYPAFLAHGSVVVLLQSLVDTWDVSGLCKAVTVGSVALPVCWSVGWGMAKVVESIGFKGYI